VARPDPRELSKDSYAAVAGDCLTIGNPVLTRTTIRNADVRWERYPRPGEIFAVSAFTKRFTDPIVELLGTDDGKCVVRPNNATSAELSGAEIELRRALTILPGWLKQLSAGLNLSFVKSSATIPIVVSNTVETTSRTLKLQGQSDQLANASLLYATPDGRFEVSVLGNYFSDRVFRYGDDVNSAGKALSLPDTFEKGRFQLDAKMRRRLGRANLSLSARNLSDNERTFVQDSPKGKIVVGYLRPGVGVTLGVGYALR
jgi:outer membrane receptor protein involved in Fe transport